MQIISISILQLQKYDLNPNYTLHLLYYVVTILSYLSREKVKNILTGHIGCVNTLHNKVWGSGEKIAL